MASPARKRVSSTIADVIGTDGQPVAPGPRFDEGMPEPSPQFDTIADEARKSAAVARAHAEWVAELGPQTPTMSPDGPSAYPENSELIDATPEQLRDLGKRVRRELGN